MKEPVPGRNLFRISKKDRISEIIAICGSITLYISYRYFTQKLISVASCLPFSLKGQHEHGSLHRCVGSIREKKVISKYFVPNIARVSRLTAMSGGGYPLSKDLSIEQKEKLELGTALRNIGWLSFWSQLVLSTVSCVILLFSTGITSQGGFSIGTMDACTVIGAACALITTFLSWTWIRAGRRLSMLKEVKLQYCISTVLASTNLNLIGMGATLLGLQATVGSLVGKTLTTAVGYYGNRVSPPPVALDVFSIQACANTIMAHFAGLVLGNWLLRVLQKYIAREEDRELTPSAPPL